MCVPQAIETHSSQYKKPRLQGCNVQHKGRERAQQASEPDRILLTSPSFCQFVLFLFLILANSQFPIHPTIPASCHFCRHSGKCGYQGPSSTEYPEKGYWCRNAHLLPSLCQREKVTGISSQGQMQEKHCYLGQHL